MKTMFKAQFEGGVIVLREKRNKNLTHAFFAIGKRLDGEAVPVIGFSECEYMASRSMRTEIARIKREHGVTDVTHQEIVTVAEIAAP